MNDLMLGDTKNRILKLLIEKDMSTDELSRSLKINKNAVNEHIVVLERDGFIESYFIRKGSGRPKKYYKITEKGIELFPKKYAEFAYYLLMEIEEKFGQEKTSEIIADIARKMVSPNGLEKLNEFIDTMNDLGYYAKLEIDGNKIRIIRHNCVFYDLAKGNKTICEPFEKAMLNKNDLKILENFNLGNRCVVEIEL
ncbi:helix-turn-helix transcriptional regulator [Picrophilus oshimae]|uniref:Transcriptional regulator n=1 Tax=Picrophilus torridus (strain ATCC 700027 / DSM 9790 / JCM 10055 / NBRC 100828 / KAW 2/3) TaxID=1122961 RepID=Q6L007_PICTO|nr:ArsR family transcriptional regulator [Picrophilus oshimae]AAT43695.1 transcriptional regulator PadR-like family [Picrophilus oshimae DSM 9789]SMD31319.1 transcriptional regulator [Picrophilus oshimae DSM 9789]